MSQELHNIMCAHRLLSDLLALIVPVRMPPVGTPMRDKTADRRYYSCHLVCVSSSRDGSPDAGVGTQSLGEFEHHGSLGTEVGSGDEICSHYSLRCFKQGCLTVCDSNYS